MQAAALNRHFLDFAENLFDIPDGLGAPQELHEIRLLERRHHLLERLEVDIVLRRRRDDQEDQVHRLAVDGVEVEWNGGASECADDVLHPVELRMGHADAAADARGADLLALHDGIDDIGDDEPLALISLPRRLDEFLDDALLVGGLEGGNDRFLMDELGELHGVLAVTTRILDELALDVKPGTRPVAGKENPPSRLPWGEDGRGILFFSGLPVTGYLPPDIRFALRRPDLGLAGRVVIAFPVELFLELDELPLHLLDHLVERRQRRLVAGLGDDHVIVQARGDHLHRVLRVAVRVEDHLDLLEVIEEMLQVVRLLIRDLLEPVRELGVSCRYRDLHRPALRQYLSRMGRADYRPWASRSPAR